MMFSENASQYMYPESNSTHSPSNSFKYQINCQAKINQNHQDTSDWLSIQSSLDHSSSDYKILQGLLEKKHRVVVKVSTVTKLQQENELSTRLRMSKSPNFISFHCFFKCSNTLSNVNVRKSICKANRIPTDSELGILVMPFFSMGRFDKYTWSRQNFTVFKSVLKHIVCSLAHAYIQVGFLHNDTHLGNILLRKTSVASVRYDDDLSIPVEGGILPVILDFDRSLIDEQRSSPFILYQDIYRIFALARTEIDMKTTIDQTPKNVINHYLMTGKTITTDIIKHICNEIDNISIDYVQSEMKLHWMAYQEVI